MVRPKRDEVDRAVTYLLRNLDPEKWQHAESWPTRIPVEAREAVLTAARIVGSLREERNAAYRVRRKVEAELGAWKSEALAARDQLTRARQVLARNGLTDLEEDQ